MKHQFKDLDIGMKINIMVKNGKTLYPSQVLDITSNNEMIISGPIKKSEFVLMYNEEDVNIIYYVENKGRYYFKAKVVSRMMKSIYSLLIRKTSEINIVQLREYYRLPFSFEVLKEYHKIKNDKDEVFQELCEAKDISGGGIKIICNQDHKIGEEVFCSFKIQGSLIKIKGIVVRIEELNSIRYKYSLGISFKDLSEDERDLIIRFIFEQQRISRNKGLI